MRAAVQMIKIVKLTSSARRVTTVILVSARKSLTKLSKAKGNQELGEEGMKAATLTESVPLDFTAKDLLLMKKVIARESEEPRTPFLNWTKEQLSLWLVLTVTPRETGAKVRPASWLRYVSLCPTTTKLTASLRSVHSMTMMIGTFWRRRSHKAKKGIRNTLIVLLRETTAIQT